MKVEIDMDRVIIEDQIVKRPAWYGRKEWLDAWEKMLLIQEQHCDHCGRIIQQ